MKHKAETDVWSFSVLLILAIFLIWALDEAVGHDEYPNPTDSGMCLEPSAQLGC